MQSSYIRLAIWHCLQGVFLPLFSLLVLSLFAFDLLLRHLIVVFAFPDLLPALVHALHRLLTRALLRLVWVPDRCPLFFLHKTHLRAKVLRLEYLELYHAALLDFRE